MQTVRSSSVVETVPFKRETVSEGTWDLTHMSLFKKLLPIEYKCVMLSENQGHKLVRTGKVQRAS